MTRSAALALVKEHLGRFEQAQCDKDGQDTVRKHPGKSAPKTLLIGSAEPVHYQEAPSQTDPNERLLKKTGQPGWYRDDELPEYLELKCLANQNGQLHAEVYEVIEMKCGETGKRQR